MRNLLIDKILGFMSDSKSDSFTPSEISEGTGIDIATVNSLSKNIIMNGDAVDCSSKDNTGIMKIRATRSAFESGKYR